MAGISRRMLVGGVGGWLWGQRTFPRYQDHQSLLYWLGADGVRNEVRTREDWAVRRGHILASMQEVMGTLPGRGGRVAVKVLEERKDGAVTLRKVQYESEAGDWVPAWILLPARAGKAAGVVCCHQTNKVGKDEPAGLGGNANLHYAKELAGRGMVAIAADYPNFGEYKVNVYEKGYVSATMKGIVNHMRAVDVLQGMKEVDGARIGACGHSLGGHNSLFLAAFDERVKAVVTSCGFNAFPKYYGGNLKGWSHRGYMPRIGERYAWDPLQVPFDFPEILGVIAPRAVFINAPVRDANFEVSGVRDCVTAAGRVYEGVYGKRERLVAEHPEAGHDFPAAVRERAYAFLERELR